ncbi:hypothetical protein KC343_g5834 [Hortaea werneckii]|nr:hypothetical protein KC352_g11582 [Hortaea werneckii]KAI7571826.1 hypothetical protein KC317_g1303 [Hortaea werneckii]KAI7619713.1 hypothetical protein KC346_g4450 [Hortaea werneckii]KAI7627975.1 hypothetical protein KC343_g5834 [Hortaea werneckii]KAI7679816.1 hypothetical protein KC319_g2545 [Hortaea werneckii]
MQTPPSFLLDRQNRRDGEVMGGTADRRRLERNDDDNALSVAGRKRALSGFTGEVDDDNWGPSGENKRFKRTSYLPAPWEDQDELRLATIGRTSRFGGRGGVFLSRRRDKEDKSIAAAVNAAAPFPPRDKTTKTTTKGSAAFSSGVRGSSGLASRTSGPFLADSFRDAAMRTAQGKSAGFPFMVDDDSSSSSQDEVEVVDGDGDAGSLSLRSPATSHAKKPSTGLSQGFSGNVAGRQGSRDEILRRREDQRIESERLRRRALSRRKLDGASRLGFGHPGGEELDFKMEEGKDVKTEEADRVVVDRGGEEAEVITLSDSDEEGDVIAVATVASGPSSMPGLLNGGNMMTFNDGTKPHQQSNEPEKPLRDTKEAQNRPEAAPQETLNTSTTQARESAPSKVITGSASPSHHSSRLPNFSPPPSKSSALQDATERIRQERLENAKRIWQRTQARAQAEAEKARQREAEARAEDVDRNSIYSVSTPDLLERSNIPGLPSRSGSTGIEGHEAYKDQSEGATRDKASPAKQEEGTLPQAANPEINKLDTWQNPVNKPQKENTRQESLIEQQAINNQSIEDLARQRKDRQAALVREAERKLAVEAAKKAEKERQMAAYKHSMDVRLADAATHSKRTSSVEARKDRSEDVRTHSGRDERKNPTVEVGKQDVLTRRIEDEQSAGIQNPQHGARHSPNGDLRDRQTSPGGAFRNDRGQEKEDGPMSLTSSAGMERLKAANVSAEPLQTYGQSASTSAVNHQGPHRQPTSLKATAEQGGTITRVKPARSDPPHLQNFQKGHVPRIEILPEDIKLLFWRDAGNEWRDIIDDYEEATGRKKCEETLRKRYRQVKEALDGSGASKELLTRVGTGDVEAKRELDAMIPQAPGDAEKPPNVVTHQPRIAAPGKDKLGELTPQDIRLLVSRGKGMLWSQIVQDFAISTGENVSESLLRVRYKVVKEAIEKSGVDAYLLTQVMAGDDAAREKLNRLVHGVWPVPRVEKNVKVDRPATGSGHDRKPGQVSADDIRLVRWKEEGMTGAEMVEALRQTTGRSMVIKTVLKRCSQARRALEAAGVHADRALLDAVENGDQEACSRLNQLVPSTVTASHVGEILPEDVMMVQEKQKGTTYENIASAYRRKTGRHRSYSWFNERCKSVKALLDPLDIDTHLLESVASGDQEARRQLNSLVHGKWPLYASTSSTGSSENTVERLESAFQTSSRFPESTSHAQQLKPGFYMGSAYSSSYGSREDQNVSTPPTSPGSIVPQPRVEGPRPTTAGKQMNEDAFRHYLEEIREERLREEYGDTDSEEVEEDEFSPEDFCHFIYQVERREITSSEEDITIDEKNWITYGEPLTDRLKATAIASRQALIAHDRQLNDAIHAGNDWSLNRQNLNSGIIYTLDSSAGTVQVRVQEYQRSFQEQIRPSDSVAWVSRTTYTVIQRRTETARSTNTVTVTEKEYDPTLDEETDVTTEKEVLTVHETQKQKVVGDLVYTTPDLANDAAMRHFIAKTYHPDTINLTVRDVERAGLMRGFREKYAGDGEEGIPLFREMVEGEDGNSLEVWVQETRLKGPRNV